MSAGHIFLINQVCEGHVGGGFRIGVGPPKGFKFGGLRRSGTATGYNSKNGQSKVYLPHLKFNCTLGSLPATTFSIIFNWKLSENECSRHKGNFVFLYGFMLQYPNAVYSTQIITQYTYNIQRSNYQL